VRWVRQRGLPTVVRPSARALLIVVVLATSVCAPPTGGVLVGVTSAHAGERLDGFNKKMLGFNRWALRYVLEPFARCYNFVTPKFFQRRVLSILANLKGPRDVTNSLLQLKFKRAGSHGGRFIINSSLGIGGAFDPCDDWFKWPPAPSETMSETLGVWGVPLGPYFIVPIFGGTSPRHGIGRIADGFLDPIVWVVPAVGVLGPVVAWSATIYMVDGTNLLAQQMPSPMPDGTQAQWDAYERMRFDFPPYERGRDTFIIDQEDQVAE
jgi:phospholipid-binding lipoprotein MlaA